MAKRAKKPPVNPYLVADSPDELGEADRVAYDIINERRDLMPSVERIMEAEIEDDVKVRAISLFRDSLAQPGDPNRDPRVSIANAS